MTSDKTTTLRCLLFAFTLAISISLFSQDQAVFQKIDDLMESRQLQSAKALADSVLANADAVSDGDNYLKASSKLIAIQLALGSYGEGVRVGNELLNNYPGIVASSSMSVAEFYMQLGKAYHLTQSNEAKGISYLKQSYQIYENLGKTDKVFEVEILDILARSYYYQGDFDLSIETMTKVIALRNPENESEEIALGYRSIGNSYWGLKAYDQASSYYAKSLDVLYNNPPVDSLRIGQVLHAKGYIHMDQEDFETAFETFELASKLLETRNPEVSSPLVWVYGDVGRSLIELGKYDQALAWLQKALNANVFEYDQLDYYQNPPLANINDEFQHFMILKLKGEAFKDKYLKVYEADDLAGMVDCFRLADQQIDKIRESLPKAEDQSTITYYSTELYSKAITALVDVYQVSRDPSHLELAHYFMEKRKITRVHLKFLEASAKTENLLPESLVQRDQDLLDEISGLKSKLREQLKSENNDSISITQNQLFAAQENYENFVQDLKRSYPAYHSSRFDLEVASVDQIQQFLNMSNTNRGLVTYYNFGGHLRTSLITKDTIVVTSKAHDMDFVAEVSDIRKSLMNTEDEFAINPAFNDLLLKDLDPCLKQLDAITFILDPALQLMPLELLDYQGRYLFETFDIGYHFSSTLLVNQSMQEHRSSEFGGYAPSFDSLSLATLPGARLEVESISKVLGGSVFIGDKASETALKESMGTTGLLHLATHAVIDEANPEASYLQFGTTSNEDGRLHFFEIYGMDLNAQLVTLSACNTGYGKIQRGEGVMSLSRAFAYAGVPSTVVSLWPASDKSTPELMTYFYQNLQAGQDKDLALNNARKQYLLNAQGKARHPFYWGGFVMIGDNGPIEDDRNLLIYLIPSVLVVVMILTLYRRKKNA